MLQSSPTLILASSSPRRASLLGDLGVRFGVESPGVDEVGGEFGSPPAVVLENARRKGEVVSRRHPHACVLAADTAVCLGDAVFGKPASMAEAATMLGELSGKRHEVLTAVYFRFPDEGQLHHDVALTEVYFRKLGEQEIIEYLETIKPLDKAGGYAIQDGGDRIIERIEGSYSNVMGLPLEMIRPWLRGADLL